MDTAAMKEKLDALIEFQTLESEVIRLSHLLEKIPQNIEALDALFLELNRKLSDQSERVDQLKKTYRAEEREVEGILARIQKSRSKMDA
jgi:predicted  nucleic acid-binding Zn-ribbon protein